MRRKVIAGNWKMNMLPNEAMQFIEKLGNRLKENKTDREVVLCVPYTDLFYSLMMVQETNVAIGAQNMHWEDKGAYTGEISGAMLEPIGVKYVIIGHSERRQYFAETDETVNKKIKTALRYNLKPIVCVGETLEQREAGKTQQIITSQVKNALEGISEDALQKIIIAYEPIWAIGTGKTATSEVANETIKIIRNEIEKIYTKETAEKAIILYGGSVNAQNANELFNTTDIDGALVGGASLKIDEFIKIIEA